MVMTQSTVKTTAHDVLMEGGANVWAWPTTYMRRPTETELMSRDGETMEPSDTSGTGGLGKTAAKTVQGGT